MPAPTAGAPAAEFEPTGIASATAFGAFTVEEVIGENAVPTGIPTGESFGSLTIYQHPQPDGIASEEVFGSFAVKFIPEPYQFFVILRGGPYDGEGRLIGQPWPRASFTVEDEATGAHFTYVIDVGKVTEPYEATYQVGSSSAIDESVAANFVAMGEKGDRGAQGDTGPEGLPGEDGASYEMGVPTGTLPTGHVIVGEWVEVAAVSVTGHEPFGYRLEGANLVFKGDTVSDSGFPLTLAASIPYGGTSIFYAGTIISIDTTLPDTDPTAIELGAVLWNGSLDFAFVTKDADHIIGGWAQVRIPLDSMPALF